MNLPEFLSQTSEGAIRLSGHRIGLEHLLHFYREGYSPEMLWAEYPTLPLALIHKVIGYYLENQAEIDAYLDWCRTETDRQRKAAAPAPALAELRRRLEALRPAQGA